MLTPIAWSGCFAWADETHWSGAPSAYFEHLLEFIRARAMDDILVFVHENILPHIAPFLCFHNVHVRCVSKKYDAFMPKSMRFAPFFASDELTRDKLVVVADIHDDFRVQDRLKKHVLDHMHARKLQKAGTDDVAGSRKRLAISLRHPPYPRCHTWLSRGVRRACRQPQAHRRRAPDLNA